MATRIFLHGLESSNQGTKALFFQERFPDMIIPHFTGSLEARMEKLDVILAGKTHITLVGSSFGGLMATIFAKENQRRAKKMILLAPALNLMESASLPETQIAVPVWIYHGTADDVIPLGAVESIAKKTFSELSFNVVDDDHFLRKTFTTIDWHYLLA
jgi:pimeloyl-ACP methyl ester carboxylesterase